jgi:preprotein translocase subunit SecE
MEVDKIQQKAMQEKKLNKIRIRDFVEEVKAEVQRVTWTTREELQVYTKIVVASTLFFGLGIYFTDLIIQGVLNGFSSFVQLIGG